MGKKNQPHKRILFASSAPRIYGAEINLIELLRTLDTKKYKAYCLYDSRSKFEEYGISRNKVFLKAWHSPRYTDNLFYMTTSMFKLAFFLWKHRIDLIYINVAHDYKYFKPLSKLLGISVLLHIHVDEPDESLRWLKVNSAQRLLFPSRDTMKAVLDHSSWIDTKKCFYVHNAVDFSIFHPRTKSIKKQISSKADDFKFLGVVGQLKQEKGQHLFLEMAGKLCLDNINAKYIIVGEDSSKGQLYKKFLNKKAISLGINHEVFFMGFCKEIPQIMSSLDLLIVPSYHESFGRVVIEAMACGTPVVASAVGGITEIFEDGQGGLFFQSGSVQDLTKKVMYFFDHPEWWSKQGNIALEMCRKRFDQSIHTKKIEEHIQETIAHGSL